MSTIVREVERGAIRRSLNGRVHTQQAEVHARQHGREIAFGEWNARADNMGCTEKETRQGTRTITHPSRARLIR